MKPYASVELRYDGWVISVNNKLYFWDHNDEDLGTKAIVTLLEDLGYEVFFDDNE